MKHNLPTMNMPMAHRRRWSLRWAAGLLGLLMLASSHARDQATASAAASQTKSPRIWMTVGERRFAVTLADTEAARAFAARLPLTLHMADLNANEKKFDLPYALPSNASRPGTIRNGDLMLWGDNTVVVFYLSFDSPYAYTRLGRLDDPNGLAQVLGKGSVQVGFSAQQ